MAKKHTIRDNSGQFAPKVVATGLSEQTGEQNPGNRHRHGGELVPLSGMLYGNGGTLDNPMAFPGYGFLYTGTYAVYRWMLQHPVIRFVRAISVADILNNKWEYKGAKDARDDEIELIKTNFDHLRSSLMTDFFVRGRDFGWYGGELIWELRDTTTWLERVKPLLIDNTHMLKDGWGNFSGLRNDIAVGVAQGDPNVLGDSPMYQGGVSLAAPFKAWRYTYDSEAGYLYGRSWLENFRMTAWRDWLDCAQQLQKLGAKITGIQLILTAPSGTFPITDSKTNVTTQTSYKQHCMDIITQLANGAPGAYLPALNLGLDVRGKLDVAKIVAELANKSMIKADLLNHGTNAPAIHGILERMKHAEELIFMGGLKSPRTGMSTGTGGKADAEQHTDTGTKSAQIEDVDFAGPHGCQPLVDAVMVLNKGQSRKGKVTIYTPSIADNKRAYLKSMLLAAMNDPDIAAEMLGQVIDLETELKNMDISIRDNGKAKYSATRVQANKDKANKGMGTNKQPEPQGGRPTKKSGGNPKKRAA